MRRKLFGMAERQRALDGLDDEIRDHIERETEINIARGMTPDEACRQARLAFGNVTLSRMTLAPPGRGGGSSRRIRISASARAFSRTRRV